MIKLVERQVKDLPLVASAPLNAPADVLKVKAALEKMDGADCLPAIHVY